MALLVLAGALTACTIMAPIQKPASDRRFPLAVEPAADAKPPCDAKTESKEDECKPLMVDIDAFHGELGRAIWETDLRRRELLSQAADQTHLTTSYNALLWPVGAYLLAKKIKTPGWSALDAVAIATASYGFLNASIPDRDKLYLRAATRMACTMVEFDAELYDKKEIGQLPFVKDGRYPMQANNWPADGSLAQRLDMLGWQVQLFQNQRERVRTGIALKKPGTALRGATAAEQARMAALNLGGGTPRAGSDPTDAFTRASDLLLLSAQEQLKQGSDLLERLDRSGARLRQQRSHIEGALTAGLNSRTPALKDPLDQGKDLIKAFESGMAAERKLVERITKQSGASRPEVWHPTQASLAGLTKTSAGALTQFWTQERIGLMTAQTQLSTWTDRHKSRERQARADAQAMGCQQEDLAEFAKGLMNKAAEPVASGSGK